MADDDAAIDPYGWAVNQIVKALEFALDDGVSGTELIARAKRAGVDLVTGEPNYIKEPTR
jgi:hypothetical protein